MRIKYIVFVVIYLMTTIRAQEDAPDAYIGEGAAEEETIDKATEEDDNDSEEDENQKDSYTFVALIDIVFTDGCRRTCTGTIIHDNVVITAAHCFTMVRNAFLLPELSLSFIVIGTKLMFATGYEQYLPIERVTTHPKFKGWTADLALVFTFANMMSDKPGQILPLASESSITPVDSHATVLSWGRCKGDIDEDNTQPKTPPKDDGEDVEPTEGANQESTKPKQETKEEPGIEIRKKKRRKEREHVLRVSEIKPPARSQVEHEYAQQQHHYIKFPLPLDEPRNRARNSRIRVSSSVTKSSEKSRYILEPKNKKKKNLLPLNAPEYSSVEEKNKFPAEPPIAEEPEYRQDEGLKAKLEHSLEAHDQRGQARLEAQAQNQRRQVRLEAQDQRRQVRINRKKRRLQKFSQGNTNRQRQFFRQNRRFMQIIKNKQYKKHFHNWRRNIGQQQNNLTVGTFGYVNLAACKRIVERTLPPIYEIKNKNEVLCYSSEEFYITNEDSGAPLVQGEELVAVTVGGVDADGDHVAIGMKISCFCTWIAENLPNGGGANMKCCKDCCSDKRRYKTKASKTITTTTEATPLIPVAPPEAPGRGVNQRSVNLKSVRMAQQNIARDMHRFSLLHNAGYEDVEREYPTSE